MENIAGCLVSAQNLIYTRKPFGSWVVAWDKLINTATQEMLELDFEVGNWDSGRVMGGVPVVSEDFIQVLPAIHTAQVERRLPVVFPTRSTPPHFLVCGLRVSAELIDGVQRLHIQRPYREQSRAILQAVGLWDEEMFDIWQVR